VTQPKIVFYSRDKGIEYVDECIAELRSSLEFEILDLDQDLTAQLSGVEIIVDIGGLSPRPVIDAATDVKLWQVIGTGLDHCDVPYILSKGKVLSHTPGFTSKFGLAECAMMYILMLTRRYHRAKECFDQQKFYQPNGVTVSGLTLGIIGFGASGRELALRARAFGMRIEAIDVRPLEDDFPEEQRPDFYGTPDDIDEFLGRWDFVSLHLHLTPETKHIIDGRRLDLMKPTAYLINVARGALADEEALGAALLEGKIAGAGIDVFDVEPADPGRAEYHLPDVVVTPHISGQTDETIRQRCAIVVENARRMVEGEELLYTVDASQGLGKIDN
jgi:phosphoglycerate dehydrogenase-like enzyme